MNLVVVPPLADPTTVPVNRPDEQVLDLNRRFAARVAEPRALLALAADLDTRPVATELLTVAAAVARRDTPSAGRDTIVARRDAPPAVRERSPDEDGPIALAEPAPLDPAERCLLALAAADALQVHAGPLTQLRALAAATRALSAGDAGLRACVDAVELRTGSTQSSADALLAAGRTTLFDDELRSVPADGAVHVLIDVDRQLPGALRLISRLGRHRQVSASGRFVAAHLDALRRVAALSHVRLVPEARPWEVRAGWGTPGGQPLRWVPDRAQCPDTGEWAGWLEASEVLALPATAVERCRGLVVTVGAFHPELRDLGAMLPEMVARIPVGVEIVVGAPGWPERPDPHAGAPEFVTRWWPHGAHGVRVAGFRPYRPARGAAALSGHDLAQWGGPVTEHTMARLRAMLRYSAARHELFPGRVAGALFATDTPPSIVDQTYWDPAVRLVRTQHVAPRGSQPGDYLVSLRTGALTLIKPELAALLARLRHGGPGARRALAELTVRRRAALLDRLRGAGVLRTAAVSGG